MCLLSGIFIFNLLIDLQAQSLNYPDKPDEKMKNSETIQKVMRAMLAMQRRAWEQGVVSQALLEMGETE